MCVIMASATGKRIPEHWLELGYESNQHGAGLAWRDAKRVHWRKGLNLNEFMDAYRKIPENAKHVTHFRIASCGGIGNELTHPFPLTDDATLLLEGSTRGAVLFHNGHYHMYRTKLEDMAAKSGGTIKIPFGPWSDSRAMAYIAHKLGPGVLPFFDEKIIYFSPDRFDVYGTEGNKWILRDGIHLSNNGWDRGRASRFLGSGGSTDKVSSPDKEDPPKGALPSSLTSSSKGESEASPDKRPFLLDPGLWPRPPASCRTKGQLKRWRKRMEEKHMLPPGPLRHRIRQRTKYLEDQTRQLREAQELLTMRTIN